MKKFLILPALYIALSACTTTGDTHAVSPADHVIYQTVYKAVRQPCPVTKPKRPGDAKTHGLARPLPTDLGALVDVLLAKLKEWDGPGKYADQTDSAIEICTRPVPPDGTPVTP